MMTDRIKVLLVADNPAEARMLQEAFRKEGAGQFDLTSVPLLREALKRLDQGDINALLLDLELPDSKGLDTLLQAYRHSPDVPIVVLTGIKDDTTTVAAIRSGAQDYLIKGEADGRLLERAILCAIERKRTEAARRRAEELERHAKIIEATNAELESFSYSISHDLRAPLRAMQGFAQALLEDYGDKLDSVGQEYARRIVDAAASMDGLIQDILSYSQLSRADITLGPTDLEIVVRSALGQVEAEAQKTNAEVLLQGPWPTVSGHPATLIQVVQNLLANAVKFVAPGVRPRVLVRTERRDGWVRLWVEDNGIGIAPEHHERIFNTFERLHGREQYPGTGIGLAVVRRGMVKMGGRSGVESAVNQGSRFWVELPWAELTS